MRSTGAYVLLALALSSAVVTWAAPVPAQDVEKLEELKTKLEGLQKVLLELNAKIHDYVASTNGKTAIKRVYVPAPQVAPADQDTELSDFEKSLSPEDLRLLQSLKHKVKYLQAVLHETPGGNNPGDTSQEEETPKAVQLKSEIASGAQATAGSHDQEMAQFEATLTPEQIALLKKMRDQVNKMKAAMLKPTQVKGPSVKSIDDRELEEEALKSLSEKDKEALKNMSEEDKKLLENNRSKLQYLLAALHQPQGVSDSRDIVKPAPVPPVRRTQPAAQDVEIPPTDHELMKDVEAKIQTITDLLNAKDNKASQGQMEVIIEDGHFEAVKNSQDKRGLEEGWHNEPLAEEQLGAVENSKRCIGDGCDCVGSECEVGPMCPECFCDGCQCREGRCEQPVIAEAAKRLVDDMQYAKDQGVDLKQLMTALTSMKDHARRANLVEANEKELSQLRVRKSVPYM